MAFARSAAAVALRRNVYTQYRQIASFRTITQPALRPGRSHLVQTALVPTPNRWLSTNASSPKVYEFGDIKKLAEAPNAETVLIDVREPSEFAAGYIPSAINIPIKSQPDAMFLPADEFEDRFGFGKPSADKELVFYCKSGVRSSAAAQIAQQIGYKKVSEYRGSWMDWEKNGGGASKP